jgi:hypothetical protein
MGGGVSLPEGDDRDSKLLCRELVRMCRGVYEAPCILLTLFNFMFQSTHNTTYNINYVLMQHVSNWKSHQQAN